MYKHRLDIYVQTPTGYLCTNTDWISMYKHRLDIYVQTPTGYLCTNTDWISMYKNERNYEIDVIETAVRQSLV